MSQDSASSDISSVLIEERQFPAAAEFTATARIKEADLAGTTYRFVLEDGNVIEAQGNETIVYDGEAHTAANLYDALKEGYYGRL